MEPSRTTDFTRFLNRAGKKPHVVEGLIRQVEAFEDFLARRGKSLDQAVPQDALDYAAHLESHQAGSASGQVRGAALFYKSLDHPTMAATFSELRAAAIAARRKGFALSGFLGVAPEHVARLQAVGIRTAEQMLASGRTPRSRLDLAERSGVPVEAVLDLVRMSDLSRISGVKAIRARLYVDAGADSVETLAALQPDELLQLTAEFIRRTDFKGIAPLPKEVRSTIESARRLPTGFTL